MRRLLRWVTRLIVSLLVFAGGAIAWAHWQMAGEGGPLPEPGDAAADASLDAPLRLAIVNTASQAMARGGTLAAAGDPTPDKPFVMSHPAFVLEWADGRLLLIDVGMTPEQAVAFGRPLEWLRGAAPAQPHGAAAEALGAAAARVGGVVFTHPHTDHVGGLAALCARAGHELPVFMSVAQAERPNYTTRPGLADIAAAPCARPRRLEGGALMPVPGFQGVAVIDAGGHTPGSQIILTTVGAGAEARRYAFTGDIVNNLDGILYDLPKPWLYRTLLIPESDARQQELRRFLKALQDEAGYTLLVSHDQLALEASGVPPWRPGARD